MNLAELEAALSRPTPAAIDALGGPAHRLEGDLVVLGAGGKMGPSLSRMARRALDAAGADVTVHAVARFSDPVRRRALEAAGVHTIACDLLDRRAVQELPDAAAVMFLAGTKFGTADDPSNTWAQNALVPGIVAERYAGVPTVVFSSGNVYPLTPVAGRGATEATPPGPVGEYAWSVLARERVFAHFASTRGTKVAIYRLNYAAELRYGVPLDIARKVLDGSPIDLSMGHVNVIWQGDANAMALACLGLASAPATILNVTGDATVPVRDIARRFGELFGRPPELQGSEAPTALLSDATRAIELFGPLTVDLPQLTTWIADWLRDGGVAYDKPTHFEVRDGTY